jgi:hypothetical protein
MGWNIDGTFERENGPDPIFKGDSIWQNDQQAGIKIIDARHDYSDEDLAQGIAATLNLDGYNAMRANLNMGGQKITGLDLGTQLTDGPTYGQISGSMTFDDGLRVLTLFDRLGDIISFVTIPSGSGGGGTGTVTSITVDNTLESYGTNPITTVGQFGLKSIGTDQSYSGGISGVVVDEFGRVTQVTTGAYANTDLGHTRAVNGVIITSSTGSDTTIFEANINTAGMMGASQVIALNAAANTSTANTWASSQTFSNGIIMGPNAQLTWEAGIAQLMELPDRVNGSRLPTSLPPSGEMWNDGGFVKVAP